MLRREARERREFIFRKQLEAKQRLVDEKRSAVANAVNNDKMIATGLRKDALKLQKDAKWGEQVQDVDDEYRHAGVVDPRVMITTSGEPSASLKRFVKELKLVFPNSQRVNRGQYNIKQLVQACRANDATDLVVVTESRGNPDGLIVCHLPFGPTAEFQLANVVQRHDVPDQGHVSQKYPHLVFHNFSTQLGRRVVSILKHLFAVPKKHSKRVMSFVNERDFISFRHYTYAKSADEGGAFDLTEQGPRFEMKLYRITLGTADQLGVADVEWVSRPYLNTARKRQFLALEEDDDDGEHVASATTTAAADEDGGRKKGKRHKKS